MINKSKTHVRNMAKGIGTHAVNHAVAQNMGEGKPLDPGLGWRMLRDGRVPVGTKMASVGLGVLMMFVLQALEIPVQGLLALALPIVGWVLNGAIDGMEAILAPVLFASLLLPHLAPKQLVAQIRQEPTGRMRRVN